MHDPVYYRMEAQKYVEQAQNAKSPQHRLILLEEAQTMTRLAQQAEMMRHVVDDESTAVSVG